MNYSVQDQITQLNRKILAIYFEEGVVHTGKKLVNELKRIENKIERLELFNYEENNDSKEISKEISRLREAVKTIRLENFIYNAEDELDRMFPDRHDPDFDEDSISGFDFDYFD